MYLPSKSIPAKDISSIIKNVFSFTLPSIVATSAIARHAQYIYLECTLISSQRLKLTRLDINAAAKIAPAMAKSKLKTLFNYFTVYVIATAVPSAGALSASTEN